MALERRRERLAPRTGTGDEDEAGVHPARPHPAERQPHERAGEERDRELDREQQHEEEAADVRQLEPEEHRERRHGHEHGGAEEVAGLGADRPAGTRSVEAVHREGHDPADRVHRQEGQRVGDDLAPPPVPDLAESEPRKHDEDHGRQEGVRDHEQGAQAGAVSADQGDVGPYEAVGASAQWYRCPIARSQAHPRATACSSQDPIERGSSSVTPRQSGHDQVLRRRPAVHVVPVVDRVRPELRVTSGPPWADPYVARGPGVLEPEVQEPAIPLCRFVVPGMRADEGRPRQRSWVEHAGVRDRPDPSKGGVVARPRFDDQGGVGGRSAAGLRDDRPRAIWVACHERQLPATRRAPVDRDGHQSLETLAADTDAVP